MKVGSIGKGPKLGITLGRNEFVSIFRDISSEYPGSPPLSPSSKKGFNHSIIRPNSDNFFYFFEYQSSQVEIRKCNHINQLNIIQLLIYRIIWCIRPVFYIPIRGSELIWNGVLYSNGSYRPKCLIG